MNNNNKVTEEYFTSLLENISSEAEKTFTMFDFIKKEIRSKINNIGQVEFCELIFIIKAKTKFINFWFVLSSADNKPYSVNVSLGDNKDDQYSFNLKDFLSFNNAEINNQLFFHWLKNYEDSLDLSKNLFSEILKLTHTPEFDKILNTDFKPKIPKDYSPYK